jgi:myo-inositol-1-phosphate synthase
MSRNGRKRLRVGIIGVGNCASSFVQGLTFYRNAEGNEPPPGLMHLALGDYEIGDIEISAAFDVDARKVGRDVSEAIYAPPNNTFRFAEVAPLGVRVERGPTMDGLGRYVSGVVEESDAPPADVTEILARSGTDVVISYLPVGSQRAAEWYTERVLEAGCAFVNCMPVFIASRPEWESRFRAKGLPIIGDDIKSQVGATIVHRVLTNLFKERGVRLDRTYQLNFGGNTDFQNMLERERLESKKISKTQSVDAVRCAKLALDRGESGALVGPSSYFMKSPPRQFSDAEARERVHRFIEGEVTA